MNTLRKTLIAAGAAALLGATAWLAGCAAPTTKTEGAEKADMARFEEVPSMKDCRLQAPKYNSWDCPSR